MRKLSLRAICLTLAIMACLVAGCGDGGGGHGKGSSTTRQWTYLVYMGADNNLADMGVGDIKEMAQIGSTDEVAIVVQAEFNTFYTDEVADSSTYRGLVQKGGFEDNLATFTNIGDVNMGSPEALADFITWGTTTYPAEHYALIIWDHGAGWKDRSPRTSSSLFRGAVADDSSNSFMTLPELGNAVRNAGVHLDILNFDACLMAMYEVAYEYKGLIDYLIFSEETEPGDGDPYDTILGDLSADPSMTAAQLASTIVDRYDESYVNYSATYNKLTTKSAVDMSRLDTVDAALLTLVQALMNDATANTVAMEARTNSQHFYYSPNHDIHDLASYIHDNAPDGAARDAAATLISAVQSMVYNNATNPDDAATTSTGLAIYMPTASQTSASDLSAYAALACNATSRASASGTWGAYIEWLLEQEDGTASGSAVGGFSVTLTWATPTGEFCDSDFDLWVYEPNGEKYSAWSGTSPNGTFSEDSNYSGESMEYYHANDEVDPGYYHFEVQYYQWGLDCDQAVAQVVFNDGAQGSEDFVVTSDIMDLSNHSENDPADTPGCQSAPTLPEYLTCMSDYYSDLFYAGWFVVGEADDTIFPTTQAPDGEKGRVSWKKLHTAKPAKAASVR